MRCLAQGAASASRSPPTVALCRRGTVSRFARTGRTAAACILRCSAAPCASGPRVGGSLAPVHLSLIIHGKSGNDPLEERFALLTDHLGGKLPLPSHSTEPE